MSEYQYYEFRTLDRPLSDAEMSELRAFSTRAEITATSFTNEYNWGDFKADPELLVERYFDAHVYVTNWGINRFLMRLPANLVDIERLQEYLYSDVAWVKDTGEHVLIDLTSNTEYPEGWAEGSGWMSELASVRAELLAGDMRALYLGWLLSVQEYEVEDDEVEPPVPPGLADLSATLVTLIDFLRIDEDLVTAAAEASEQAPDESERTEEIAGWISMLPVDEKNTALMQVMVGKETAARWTLLRRFTTERTEVVPTTERSARTAGTLRERAEQLSEVRELEVASQRAEETMRQQEAAFAVQQKRLDTLAGRRESAWKEVDELISSYKPKAYQAAVALLEDLKALGSRDGDAEGFESRLAEIRARHGGKRSFIARLQKAGL